MKTLFIILSILRVAFVGDPQVDDRRELGFAQKSIYKELRARRDIDLVIVLGDLVNDNPSLIAESKAALDSLKCPWICTPGNHDKDVYKKTNHPRDTKTFRDVLGYTDTCIVMNGVRFICIDNVRSLPRNNYEGGLNEKQKEWLKKQLENSSDPVVLCAHIPFSECKGKDTLAVITAPYRDRLLMFCGHTHNVRRRQLKEFGCEEVQAGASCGSWWRGVPDEHGIPSALMNCGAPRGYFIVDFNAIKTDWYKMSYKCVGRKAKEQMSVTIRDDKLFVNVYGGCTETGLVEIYSEGKWQKAEVANAPATEVLEIIEFNRNQDRDYRKSHRDEFIPMRKLNSPHLWSSESFSRNKKPRVRYSDPTYKNFCF